MFHMKRIIPFLSSFILISWILFADSEKVSECRYVNETYQLGEKIPTNQSCYHCTCTTQWKEPLNFDDCAVVDCPWDYYNTRPHCSYTRYIKSECCPIPDCGPWHPDMDDSFFGAKRPKLSMDKVNSTMAIGVEMTLFCVDSSGNATSKTRVTWSKKSLLSKPVSLTFAHSYVGTSKILHSKHGKKSTYVTRHTWGLYIERSKLEDTGQYTCTIHTKPIQTETSFVFIQSRAQKKLRKICFDEQPQNTTCDSPVNSEAYFNVTSLQCTFDPAPTCAPVGNRFSNMDECSMHCWVYTCQGKPEVSPCTNQFLKYFYNEENDTCQAFMYGGCGSNMYGNNYRTLKDCEDVCQKVKFQIASKHVPAKPKCKPCAWNLWVHYLYRGCQPKWKKDSCCPVYFQCSQNSEKTPLSSTKKPSVTYQCYFEGKTYNASQVIEIKNACQVCQCTIDFKGSGSPNCKPQTCGSKNTKDILANTNCIPVYTNHSCCPMEMFCPPSVVYAQRPHARLHPELAELHCEFGKMKYPRGFRYLVRDQCLVCQCLTPPQFTCERTICDYPAIDYCPWLADTECCCPNKTINEDSMGAPRKFIEIQACAKAACPPYHKCLVNPTLCVTKEKCKPKCELCPVVNCSSVTSSLATLPYKCPNCVGPYTPERACEWKNCSKNLICVVALRGRLHFTATCEAIQQEEAGFINRFSMTLCNIKCPHHCRLLPSVDNTCPICHCS